MNNNPRILKDRLRQIENQQLTAEYKLNRLRGEREALRKLLNEVKNSEKQANDLIKRKEFILHLCGALQKVSNDAFEIAKILTTAIVPLALVGTVSIQFNPVLVAWIALLVSRMGIASLCAGIPKETDSKSENA
jgi:hypothetical protein